MREWWEDECWCCCYPKRVTVNLLRVRLLRRKRQYTLQVTCYVATRFTSLFSSHYFLIISNLKLCQCASKFKIPNKVNTSSSFRDILQPKWMDWKLQLLEFMLFPLTFFSPHFLFLTLYLYFITILVKHSISFQFFRIGKNISFTYKPNFFFFKQKQFSITILKHKLILAKVIFKKLIIFK